MAITAVVPDCPYCATNSGIHDFHCLGCVRRTLNAERGLAGGRRLEGIKDAIRWMGFAHHVAELEHERNAKLSLLRSRAA